MISLFLVMALGKLNHDQLNHGENTLILRSTAALSSLASVEYLNGAAVP